MKLDFDEERIRQTLTPSWSSASAVQWTHDTPWAGQCNVTSAVVAELFGAEILRTPWNERTDHYYNRVNGKRVDFTDMQFDQPIEYQDVPTTLEEVRGTIPPSEVDALRGAFLLNWKGDNNGI